MRVQLVMNEKGMRALPVVRGEKAVGVVTIEDISRADAMAAQMA